jgi:hypothetical protein
LPAINEQFKNQGLKAIKVCVTNEQLLVLAKDGLKPRLVAIRNESQGYK